MNYIEPNEIGYLSDAIKSLDPDAQFSVRDTDLSNINWTSTPIARSEIDAEVVRLKALWTVQEYARNRASAFPSTGDQLDMQYWDQVNGTTTWKDAIAKVKSDNPKPE